MPGSAQRLGLTAHLTVRTAEPRFSPSAEKTIYFFISEALTNVYKHAQTDQVWVSLRLVDKIIIAEVRDDGVGGAAPTGRGLTGMHDRIAAFGGHLDIASHPGQGTRLTASLPAEAS